MAPATNSADGTYLPLDVSYGYPTIQKDIKIYNIIIIWCRTVSWSWKWLQLPCHLSESSWAAGLSGGAVSIGFKLFYVWFPSASSVDRRSCFSFRPRHCIYIQLSICTYTYIYINISIYIYICEMVPRSYFYNVIRGV